jgi:GNAT superfamily N-acetyltransferase
MKTQSNTSEYEFTTDTSRMDIDIIHGYLRQSYWPPDIAREVVERAIDGSICFGIFDQAKQIGFARVVTDKATFAYLADVFILEPHRGKGLSKQLMKIILEHPDLQGLRRFLLATRDAHGLYQKFDFTELGNPARFMELHRPKA